MPLISFKNMLDVALNHNFAVGYFQAWNQDSLEAVLAAGEKTESPVILGFGGTYVNQGWFNNCGLEYNAALGRVAAEKSKVPVCLILNEAETYDLCLKGIRLGFNVVMLDGSSYSYQENLEINKRLVRIAHANHVGVQAELGRLPEGGKDTPGEFTDPGQAREFIRETGIDALSVSIGNVHVLTKGTAHIDVALVERIRKAVQIPLVVHGGTGFPPEAVKDVIKSGVALFHIGTILKMVYFEGLKKTMQSINAPENINKVVGSQESEDFFADARNRITEKVTELIRLYGSAGKASLYR